MNTTKLISYAEDFLNKHKADFVRPGKIGRIDNRRVEVIFLVPLALNPNVVIDPPDIRLWVNIDSGEIEIIEQM